MSDPVIFTCIGGHQFTEAEMDMGMTFATMDYLMEQDRAASELAADLHREEELAKEHVLFLEDDPHWPWYADLPFIVEEPQVFGP